MARKNRNQRLMEDLARKDRARDQHLLTSLRESIVDKPPYISGILQLPDSCFSLFYKVSKDGHAARHIDLANATPDELEQLTQACEPASFGMSQETVWDETYRKAGKMDTECFTPSPMLDPVHSDLLEIIRGYLLEGTQSTKNIKAELYKLNVYGKGSFFKSHVDTPRSEKMFGSLVVVFPTPHEGGALLLRHRGHEWIFDSGQALAAKKEPSICYVAFFSDIEHEVAPVISGHHVTLTYSLYCDDNLNRPVSARHVHLTPPNEGAFREVFKTLLENPEFMAGGGTLAFGLRHVYPIENSLEHVYNILKGSDAVVYQSFRALGYEPVLYLYYQDEQRVQNILPNQGVIIDKLVNFPPEEGDYRDNLLLRYGGILVRQDSSEDPEVLDSDVWVAKSGTPGHRELLEWVTPVTEFNRQKGAYLHYGNDSSLEWAYGDVCLVVRIGKAGDRMAYTTVAELKEAYHKTSWYKEIQEAERIKQEYLELIRQRSALSAQASGTEG